MSIILTIFVLIAGEADFEQRAHDDQKVSASQPAISAGKLCVLIPPPINEDDIRSYAWMLRLSEEQNNYLEFLYQQYAEQWNALLSREWPLIDSLNAAVAEAQFAHQFTWDAAQKNEQFITQQLQVVAESDVFEQAIFRRLQDVLTPEQMEWLWRPQAQRTRQKCSLIEMGMSCARIDLSVMVYKMIPLGDASWVNIDPILIEYEKEITEYFQKEDAIQPRRLIKSAWFGAKLQYDQSGQLLDRTNPNSLKTALDDLENLRSNELKDEAQLQEKIAKINRDTLKKIISTIDAAQGAKLEKYFRLRVWSKVYADIVSPDDLHERIMTDTSLDGDQIKYIESSWESAHKRYEEISRQMADEIDRMDGAFVRTLGLPDYDQYQIRMRDWRDDRWKIGQEFSDRLKSVFREDQENLRYNVNQFQKWLRDAKDAAKFDSFPGV